MPNYTFKLIESSDDETSRFRNQFVNMARQLDSGHGIDMENNLHDINIPHIENIPEFITQHFGSSITPLDEEPFINPDGGRQSVMITVQPTSNSECGL
ncbi:MAG: hypothetical protein ACRBDL_07510 [Alphaproteobacteria bacterium]